MSVIRSEIRDIMPTSGCLEADLVSVVIPTYNRADLVCAAIDSVLNQTHHRIETIVVDDGSTDNTLEVLAVKYGNRIRAIRQPNGGVCAARNAGIAASRGDFIALLDSDDRWLPWKLAAQIEAFRRFPDLQMVYTNLSVISRTGSVLRESELRNFHAHYKIFSNENIFHNTEHIYAEENDPECTLRIGDFSSLIFMGNFFPMSTVMLPSALVKDLGGFNQSVGNSGEDYEFFSRVTQKGPIGLIDASATLCAVRGNDNLSLLRTHTALANLDTMERIFRLRNGNIHLPAELIAARRREAELWAGLALFDDDRLAEARVHLGRGLRMGGRRPRAIGCWMLAHLPVAVVRGLRLVHHRLKQTSRNLRSQPSVKSP